MSTTDNPVTGPDREYQFTDADLQELAYDRDLKVRADARIVLAWKGYRYGGDRGRKAARARLAAAWNARRAMEVDRG